MFGYIPIFLCNKKCLRHNFLRQKNAFLRHFDDKKLYATAFTNTHIKNLIAQNGIKDIQIICDREGHLSFFSIKK